MRFFDRSLAKKCARVVKDMPPKKRAKKHKHLVVSDLEPLKNDAAAWSIPAPEE